MAKELTSLERIWLEKIRAKIAKKELKQFIEKAPSPLWHYNFFHGFRIKLFTKLLLFLCFAKARFKMLNEAEWRKRKPKERKDCKWVFYNYLSSPDEIEIEYLAKCLGISKRTIYDYWKLAYRLMFILEVGDYPI
jgi:hypothetical protein